VTAAEDKIRNAEYRYGQDVQDNDGNTVTINADVLYTRAGTEVVALKPSFDPNVGTDDEPPDAEQAPGDETPVPPVVVTCPPQDPIAVAQQLVDEVMTHRADQTLIVRWWRGDHYTWVGNCWLEQSTPKLRAALYRALQNAWYPVEVLGVQILAPWQPTRRKVGDLLEALQALIHLDERVDPPQWLVGGDRGAVISVGNGNMSVAGRTITDHTPRLFNLTCLPFDYEPDTPAPQVCNRVTVIDVSGAARASGSARSPRDGNPNEFHHETCGRYACQRVPRRFWASWHAVARVPAPCLSTEKTQEQATSESTNPPGS
jgi:hypothetical protein